MSPLVVGVIGCGAISESYFAGAARSQHLHIAACADGRPELAQAKAGRHGVVACSAEQLLADPAIELVLNLTPPLAHAPVGLRILEAGKHLYVEKPLADTVLEAKALLACAELRGLRIGCAPDTFLGASHQAVRAALDAGAIGAPIAGSMRLLTRGMEAWHPNPGFFFRPGGGPVLDLGPYHVTQLVNLLGPVAAVTAFGRIGLPRRIVGSGPLVGQEIKVEVPTTVQGALQFCSGVQVALSLSWDVWQHSPSAAIEIHGSDGSLTNADPINFGGESRIAWRDGPWTELGWEDRPFGAPNMVSPSGRSIANYRGAGLVDMAIALRTGRPHRASGQLALHVLEVLEGLERSIREGRHIDILSTVDRPQPLPVGQGEDVFLSPLDSLT